jgi:glucuronate isomerase
MLRSGVLRGAASSWRAEVSLAEILEHARSIRIIDCHEHLMTPQRRREKDTDLFDVLHYLESDLISSGMPVWLSDEESPLSDEEKAREFLKYWPKTENTTYARVIRTALRDLYGFDDFTLDGVLALNEKVLAATRDPGWYREVLDHRSGIDLVLTLTLATEGRPVEPVDFEMFRPVMFFDRAVLPRTVADLRLLERDTGASVTTLKDYLRALDDLFEQYLSFGMVATKLGIAYRRTLNVGNPGFREAEKPLGGLIGSEELSWEQLKPLQDYLIRHVIRRSIESDLPIQVHTGHQEPSVTKDGNVITNSRVSELVPLLLEHREARFVLLHSGFPYHQEYLSIAKNFPNVYADLSWLYIISPTAARTVLRQMIEMVPRSKVIGFGGDFKHVEGTYAHSILARETLARVLIEKVEEGAMSGKSARRYLDLVLRENPLDIYDLSRT